MGRARIQSSHFHCRPTAILPVVEIFSGFAFGAAPARLTALREHKAPRSRVPQLLPSCRLVILIRQLIRPRMNLKNWISKCAAFPANNAGNRGGGAFFSRLHFRLDSDEVLGYRMRNRSRVSQAESLLEKILCGGELGRRESHV